MNVKALFGEIFDTTPKTQPITILGSYSKEMASEITERLLDSKYIQDNINKVLTGEIRMVEFIGRFCSASQSLFELINEERAESQDSPDGAA